MMGPERALSICCDTVTPNTPGRTPARRHDVPAVQRQIDHAPAVDEPGEHRADGIHQRRGAVHGHLRFERADLEPGVHAQVLIDGELDAGAHLPPEAVASKTSS